MDRVAAQRQTGVKEPDDPCLIRKRMESKAGEEIDDTLGGGGST